MFIWSNLRLRKEDVQENINFKENLIDPSNINGDINNWCACCAGRVSHATGLLTGPVELIKTEDSQRQKLRDSGILSRNRERTAQFAFRCRAILCIFKFVIAELSLGTGKFLEIRAEKVEHCTKACMLHSTLTYHPWVPLNEVDVLHTNWLFLSVKKSFTVEIYTHTKKTKNMRF